MNKEYRSESVRANGSETHIHKNLQHVLNGIGATLSAVSAIFTIMLMWQFSTSPFACVLYTVVGMCFQLGQVIFSNLAGKMFERGRHAMGFTMLLFSIAVMLMSITASMGYFSGSHDVEVEQSRKASDEYVSAKRNVDLISQQIATETTTQSTWTRKLDTTQYRTRVGASINDSRASLKDLQERLVKAKEEMREAGRNSPTLVSESMFSNISKTLNLLGLESTSDKTKLIYFVAVSILIDLMAIFCFSVSRLADKWMHHELPDGSDPTSKRPSLDKNAVSIEKNSMPATSSSVTAVNAKFSENEERGAENYGEKGTVNLSKHSDIKNHDIQENSNKNVFLFEDAKGGTLSAKKRDHESHDTGTEKGKNLRYRMMVQKIKRGELKPSIRAVKLEGKCDYATAAKYLSGMAEKGIIERVEDGTYKLIVKRPKLKAVK